MLTWSSNRHHHTTLCVSYKQHQSRNPRQCQNPLLRQCQNPLLRQCQNPLLRQCQNPPRLLHLSVPTRG
ncbi:hypothetical protein ATCV1_z336L [Acanthocystis turfacea chlorella virus 1]|uniref:Uncharacterized protein z336L n=1 Tax=Chlorovirus heliozoae TaxID=322019 RepID=A7K8U6_9PHYC|nr:hypothetical protein ATCV1_z336L [Acanthocystis turfacea chlorella virus 1]ABT16470.1 hypothetical protein ATCV1_z336L [Acanthocystis turfacea chlorella virus 1]